MNSAASSEDAVVSGEEGADTAACRHHWIIERPSGPVSKGRCRLCNEERDFQNYFDSYSWGYDFSLDHLSGPSVTSGMGIGGRKAAQVEE